MRHLFLFSLIAFSTTIHAAELEKIWELELQITGETRRLVVELTDEPSESCSFGRARKVRTIEGKVPTHEFFSGYSYAVYDGVIIIDLLPLICDAGNLLRGKIEGGTISGEILSSSIRGLENVGAFEGMSVEQQP